MDILLSSDPESIKITSFGRNVCLDIADNKLANVFSSLNIGIIMEISLFKI